MRNTRPAALLVALVVWTAAKPAVGAEYCVTCSGPAAMYACAIAHTQRDAPVDPRMQLLCIQELARQGGHDSCSVPRSAPQPCPGVMKTVAAPSLLAPTGAEAAVNDGEPDPKIAKEAEPPAPGTPPRTVEELATRTLEASKTGLKKAGDAVAGSAEKTGETVEQAGGAVGSAAKKTWRCLTSLFSEC